MDQDQEIIDAALARNPNVDPMTIKSKVAEVRQSNPGISNQQIIQSITAHADNMDSKRSNMVKESVLTKYADSFSPEARARLVQANQDSGNPFAASLASFGAGLKGENQDAAFNNTMALSQAKSRGALEQFDLGKKSSREDYTFDQQQRKDAQDAEMYGINKTRGDFDFQQKQTLAGRETADYNSEQEKKIRESDPTSEESKIAQALAKEMMPSKDFSKVPASRLKELLPTIVKKYDIEADKQARAIAAQDRAIVEKAKSEEKGSVAQAAVDKDFAPKYVEYISTGRNNAVNSIQKLESLAKELDDDQGVGEAGGGRIANELPDWSRSRDSIRRRDEAYNAALAVVKELLPGTVSDSDREAVAKSFYNDALDNKQNAAILKSKIAEFKANLRSKDALAKHYETTGSLKGLPGVDSTRPLSPGRYPMTLKKNGDTATISNERQERDARAKGWN